MSCSRDQRLYIPSEGCGTRCTYSLGLEAEWAPLEAEGVVVHLHADSLGRLLRVDLGGLVSRQRRGRAHCISCTLAAVLSYPLVEVLSSLERALSELLGEVCPPVMVTTHPTASTASPPPWQSP